jgi:predicted dithiol-disulfide oxidoreductase (DUF899 family)
MSLPDVVSREQWLEARRRLLAREKEFTRSHDALNADRRRLPMVKVDKEYVFVMFGPDWDKPCPGCSAAIDELSPGVLEHVASRDTAFVLASRAPYDKIAATAQERGWTVASWYSTHGSDFNYDYQVSLDADRGQAEYNYRAEPSLLDGDRSAEMPGYSCFLREDDEIFHTYSAFARGTEYVGNAYTYLDMTALGRQEDWEEPKGRVAPVRGGDPTFTS